MASIWLCSQAPLTHPNSSVFLAFVRKLYNSLARSLWCWLLIIETLIIQRTSLWFHERKIKMILLPWVLLVSFDLLINEISKFISMLNNGKVEFTYSYCDLCCCNDLMSTPLSNSIPRSRCYSSLMPRMTRWASELAWMLSWSLWLDPGISHSTSFGIVPGDVLIVKVIDTNRLIEKTKKITAYSLLLNMSYFICSSFFHISGIPRVL